MTREEVKQAIAHHEKVLQNMPHSADTPERWEHLGAIAALKARLDEHLIAAVENSFHSPATASDATAHVSQLPPSAVWQGTRSRDAAFRSL